MLKKKYSPNCIEAGLDEAGRGCLAGPVFASAVIIPESTKEIPPELQDSKKLNPGQRKELRDWITTHTHCSIAQASVDEIDEHNILQASILAMHRAIMGLNKKPEHLLIDGNRFNQFEFIPHTCIIQGDSKYYSIAAASILAKTERDTYMQALSKAYPGYGWERNFAYPTQAHRKAIAKLGPTPHHRKSFKLLPTRDPR